MASHAELWVDRSTYVKMVKYFAREVCKFKFKVKAENYSIEVTGLLKPTRRLSTEESIEEVARRWLPPPTSRPRSKAQAIEPWVSS